MKLRQARASQKRIGRDGGHAFGNHAAVAPQEQGVGGCLDDTARLAVDPRVVGGHRQLGQLITVFKGAESDGRTEDGRCICVSA